MILETGRATGTGQPTIVNSSKGTFVGNMSDGAHITLLVSVPHEWRFCPGVSYQEPEDICGADVDHAHGTCTLPPRTRDERSKPVDERIRDHFCVCHEGYRPGLRGDCTVECPGGWRTPCMNHGRCVGDRAKALPPNTTDQFGNVVDQSDVGDEVSCVCQEGYRGESCEHECPGWSAPWNRPQRECMGRGVCNFTESTGAFCTCFDSEQYYGDACELVYGDSTLAIVSDCGACNGPGEVCVDGYCSCEKSHYRVFGACRGGDDIDVSNNLGRSIGALFGILLLLGAVGGGAAALYHYKLKSRMI